MIINYINKLMQISPTTYIKIVKVVDRTVFYKILDTKEDKNYEYVDESVIIQDIDYSHIGVTTISDFLLEFGDETKWKEITQ